MAGLVGLSLSYALPITGLLSELLTSSAETEQEMVAVERIAEYRSLEPQVNPLPDAPSAQQRRARLSCIRAQLELHCKKRSHCAP